MNIRFCDLFDKIIKLKLPNDRAEITLEDPYKCEIIRDPKCNEYLYKFRIYYENHTDMYNMDIEFDKNPEYVKYSYTKFISICGTHNSISGSFNVLDNIPTFNIAFPPIHCLNNDSDSIKFEYNSNNMEKYFDRIFELFKHNEIFRHERNRYTFKDLYKSLNSISKFNNNNMYEFSVGSSIVRLYSDIKLSDDSIRYCISLYIDGDDDSLATVFYISNNSSFIEYLVNHKLINQLDFYPEDTIPRCMLPEFQYTSGIRSQGKMDEYFEYLIYNLKNNSIVHNYIPPVDIKNSNEE